MDKLVDATADYSGAELEQAVIAALYDAFDTGNDLTTEGLLKTLGEIVPLAITMREMIERCASGPDARAPGVARARRRGEEGLDGRYGAPTATSATRAPSPDDGERKLEL